MLIFDKPYRSPAPLRIAGYFLLAEFLILALQSLTAKHDGLLGLLILLVALALNTAASIFLGKSAKEMGKSWLLYGMLPALLIVGPFAFLSFLLLRNSARYKWLDEHATYVQD